MKTFDRIFIAVILLIAAIFIGANLFFRMPEKTSGGRPYRVEINRLAIEIEEYGIDAVDLSECKYVTNIEKYSGADFYVTDSDHAIMEIGGGLYRFDYSAKMISGKSSTVTAVNVILSAMTAMISGVMLFLRQKILKPFDKLTELPYELSKGNLTSPVKESKSRFFGRFMWGVDLLRDNIESRKQRELELQREKKTLMLSISHDIKTPLSAIKLYSKALSKGLYSDKEKQLEITEKIGEKADEIESFVSELVKASNEDFLEFDVKNGEFYLSELVNTIFGYYNDKLSLVHIDFSLGNYHDCILKGDIDRSVEVLQNMIENAVKYGDGHTIGIDFSEEDGCQLITVKNSGCTLPEAELLHIFESFWRGSNSDGKNGSGLGLYICRQLMHRMNGEIFAQMENSFMLVTAVFTKA